MRALSLTIATFAIFLLVTLSAVAQPGISGGASSSTNVTSPLPQAEVSTAAPETTATAASPAPASTAPAPASGGSLRDEYHQWCGGTRTTTHYARGSTRAASSSGPVDDSSAMTGYHASSRSSAVGPGEHIVSDSSSGPRTVSDVDAARDYDGGRDIRRAASQDANSSAVASTSGRANGTVVTHAPASNDQTERNTQDQAAAESRAEGRIYDDTDRGRLGDHYWSRAYGADRDWDTRLREGCPCRGCAGGRCNVKHATAATCSTGKCGSCSTCSKCGTAVRTESVESPATCTTCSKKHHRHRLF